nr:AlpA family transcriptional regulator [uncultured Acinetobacter sp.]
MQNKLPTSYHVIRIPEVTKKCGFSRSVIYGKLSEKSPNYDPTFPKPIKLSSNAVGWFEHEIIQWLELKAEQRFTC